MKELKKLIGVSVFLLLILVTAAGCGKSQRTAIVREASPAPEATMEVRETSPNGRFRMEGYAYRHPSDIPDDNGDSPEMRLIDTSSGEIVWRDAACLSNNFIWAEDSLHVSMEKSGRLWTDTLVMDTQSFTVHEVPRIAAILEKRPEFAPSPGDDIYLSSFRAISWQSPSVVRVSFDWSVNGDVYVRGEYDYDVINRTFDILSIGETIEG